MQISKNLTLKECVASQTAIRFKIDNTPSIEVIENLKILAKNIFEPTRDYFKKPIKISSGFRSILLNKKIKGSKNSQHIEGKAFDLEGMEGLTNASIFNYIKNNLVFDQLIWEYGDATNPAWVHVSFNKNKNRQEILYIS